MAEPWRQRQEGAPWGGRGAQGCGDLEKGFIRAEVVDYDTLVKMGSEAKCKAAGLLRTEGKDYVVQDGDIINVRFNI